MKIVLISFDYFDFDVHIINELKKRNIEAHHIDISKYYYEYKSFGEKIKNVASKLFLGKNIKKVKTEEFIISELQKLGKQDKILTIRPDRISKKTHLIIKNFCMEYITYFYDSSNRFSIDYLLKGIFDTIYTFDLDDSKKYNLKHITNYIYLDKKELDSTKKYTTDLFNIASIDERLTLLNKIANQCEQLKINFKFIIVGKKKPQNIHPHIVFSKKNKFIDEVITELDEAKVFLDLIRKNQNGLSFRIFEALAYQKKIITSNTSIQEYDFYNPNNILVIDEKEPEIPIAFFESPYQPLPEELYHKYTIENWVSTVFELNSSSNS